MLKCEFQTFKAIHDFCFLVELDYWSLPGCQFKFPQTSFFTQIVDIMGEVLTSQARFHQGDHRSSKWLLHVVQ